MKLPRFSSLYGRIFAVFWLTLLLVVLILSIAAQPGSAYPTYHPPSPTGAIPGIRGQYIQTDIPRCRAAGKETQPVSPTTTATRVSSSILPPPMGTLSRHDRKSKALRNFITMADSPSEPKQKLYDRWMMAGPFEVKHKGDTLLMYIGRVCQGAAAVFHPNSGQAIPAPAADHAGQYTRCCSGWHGQFHCLPAGCSNAAERVAKGEFEADPKLESGSKEFKQAGASFNQMVQAINHMIGGQQRLLSDISHELRSPLTRLRMATALAKRKQGESNELSRIDTEAERLEQMIGELLELSRMQVNSHEQREQTDARFTLV